MQGRTVDSKLACGGDVTDIFIALLKGINVGRAKRVPMAQLRALCTELGYGRVRTLLNSGNVVFTAPQADPRAVAAQIEQALAGQIGVKARTLVLTGSELDAAVSENTLTEIADNPSRLLVMFFADPGDPKRVQSLTEQDWTPEALGVGSRVAYLWCPEGVLASRLLPAIERAASDVVTSRNWSTVRKLHALTQALSERT
jgi:uncharacterized protein (DUF1697 family)